MDNVQQHNICTNEPSSQNFRSYLETYASTEAVMQSVLCTHFTGEHLEQRERILQRMLGTQMYRPIDRRRKHAIGKEQRPLVFATEIIRHVCAFLHPSSIVF
jgi:hypothetical protein